MPTNVRQFNRAVTKFAETMLPYQVKLFTKKVALDTLTRIVRKTPVDTGRARGNWQITINTASESEVNNVAGSGISDVVSQGRVALENMEPFSIVFISNNVPYIAYLEQGSSSQAPQGMVATTIEEMNQIFARIV